MEIFVLREAGVELFQPVALEVDRVDEDEASKAVHITRCKQIRDFVDRFLRDPPVNDLYRSTAVIPDTNTTITILL